MLRLYIYLLIVLLLLLPWWRCAHKFLGYYFELNGVLPLDSLTSILP